MSQKHMACGRSGQREDYECDDSMPDEPASKNVI